MLPHTDVELQADLAKTPGGAGYMSVRETCEEYMGIGKTKLYELINDKLIRTVKLGRRTLVVIESVDEYLKSLPGSEKRKQTIIAKRRNRTRNKP